MTTMSAPTPRAPMYSMRPWPKGCSRSMGFCARRMLTRDTMLPKASDRLLAASAMIAKEPVASPNSSLPRANSRFSPIPKPLPKVP